MASITKRKDTVSTSWQAIVRRKGYPQQSKAFRTKDEAQAWATHVENEMRRGLFQTATDAERMTVGELCRAFRTEFAPHHYRERTDGKEAWRFQLDRLEEYLGAYSLIALDQRIVAAYRDLRLKGDEHRRAVGDSTVRKELYLLSKVLGFAQTERGINLPRGNPVEKIRKPSDGRGRTRRLSATEWAAFELECQRSRNQWLWPAVQLAVETGMRQAELLSLVWATVDRENSILILEEPGKIKNGEPRPVPLSPKALEVLATMPKTTKGVVLPVERMTLLHAFRYACNRAGIKNFRFHDLRHEALSRLAERGDLTVLELAAVSGHKTLQMLKRYTHLQAVRIADKLARPRVFEAQP